MLQAFTQATKPLNDKLGKDLGMKKIYVEDYSIPQTVNVKIAMYNPYGETLLVPQQMVRSYIALGLSLRYKEEF